MKYKLSQIANIITGPFGSMLHQSDYQPKGISVIMPQDIDNRTFNAITCAKINLSKAEKLNKYKVIENDIVYARRGNIEKHALINKESEGAICGTGCLRVRVTDQYINPLYLSFVLDTKKSRKWLIDHAVGSNMPNINTSILGDLEVELPDAKIQNKVSAILKNLEAKINVNNKIISELESMAKTLYDYWFLQFDFPDENGKPYKSSGGKMVWNEELKREIPEGWKVEEIGTLFASNRGISYNSKTLEGDGIPMINLASFTPNGCYNHNGIKSYSGIYPKEKVLKPLDLVMCNTQQTAIDFSKDIIGRAMLVPDIFEGDIVSSHHVTVIKTYKEKENLKYYLCYLFNTKHFHRYATGYANGTNIMGLIFDGIEKYKCEIPTDNLLDKFASVVINSEKEKALIVKENQELASLRDFLLPMLMNGQVTFKEEKK